MVAAGASHGRLFRQGELAIDFEVAADRRRSGVGLAATDADGVLTTGNDGIPIFGDHDQIAILEVEVNLLARARLQMNFLESAESDLRRTLHCRELEIDLYGLISRDLACVGYGDIGGDRLSRSNCLRGDTEFAVLKVV